MWLIRLDDCAARRSSVCMTFSSCTSLAAALVLSLSLSLSRWLSSLSLSLSRWFSQETRLDKTAWAIKAKKKSLGSTVWHAEAFSKCKAQRQKAVFTFSEGMNAPTHTEEHKQPIFFLFSDLSPACLHLLLSQLFYLWNPRRPFCQYEIPIFFFICPRSVWPETNRLCMCVCALGEETRLSCKLSSESVCSTCPLWVSAVCCYPRCCSAPLTHCCVTNRSFAHVGCLISPPHLHHHSNIRVSL